MKVFWLAGWSIALAITWLLPNHYLPWPSFHSDAWCAAVIFVCCAWFALQTSSKVAWHWSVIGVVVLSLSPWLHYEAGLIPFAGQATIVFAYLIGTVLAALTGSLWERAYPGQPLDGLLLAISLAATVSVFLQLKTWLNLAGSGIFDIWSMGLSGDRPYANLGQPNQLATLLMWGVLAAAWAFNKRIVSGGVATFFAAFLLFGVALTQSRTAWLGSIFLIICSFRWRLHWRSRRLPWVGIGLFFYFVACYLFVPYLRVSLGIADKDHSIRSFGTDDLRFLAWKIFINAVLVRPWFGFGWSEVGRAQLEVAGSFSSTFAVFGHSHNLFLDLMLWLGVPIGILVSSGILVWYLMRIHQVNDGKSAIAVMFLGVVGVHSMLELPLHYAYFLLPASLVVGVLNQISPSQYQWTTSKLSLITICVVAALLLSGIIRDYFVIEESYRDARFEAARIGSRPAGSPPKVLLLTQLRENINFMRYESTDHMSVSELDWMTDVVAANPSGGRIYKLAKSLISNGRNKDGADWLAKVCKVSSPEECAILERTWKWEAGRNKVLATVPWPAEAER